MEIMNR